MSFFNSFVECLFSHKRCTVSDRLSFSREHDSVAGITKHSDQETQKDNRCKEQKKVKENRTPDSQEARGGCVEDLQAT